MSGQMCYNTKLCGFKNTITFAHNVNKNKQQPGLA